jgi:hypothetical protein
MKQRQAHNRSGRGAPWSVVPTGVLLLHLDALRETVDHEPAEKVEANHPEVALAAPLLADLVVAAVDVDAGGLALVVGALARLHVAVLEGEHQDGDDEQHRGEAEGFGEPDFPENRGAQHDSQWHVKSKYARGWTGAHSLAEPVHSLGRLASEREERAEAHPNVECEPEPNEVVRDEGVRHSLICHARRHFVSVDSTASEWGY